MITRWVTRVFDDRHAGLRLILLAISGLGYLVFRDEPDDPYAAVDWVLAGAALALCPVAARWPLAGSLATSTVFGLAACFGQASPTVPEVGATWMVLELALRLPARQVAVGVAGLVLAHVVDTLDEPLSGLPGWLYGLAVTVGVPILIGMNIRAGRQLARQADDRVAAEAHAARAGERAAIARELHDLVAHHVASMVLRVGVARHVLPDTDPRVSEVFDDLHASASTALADLRRLVAVLRDPETAAGSAYLPIEAGSLPEALAETVRRAVKNGLTVDAAIDPAVAGLDAVRGLAVLRLTQEGLTNVAKHAGPAARARVEVKMVGDAVHWELTDDGGAQDAGARRGAKRTEPEPPAAEPGHGLTGMRERVEVLGGELAAGPAGAGWQLRTVLPAGARS